MMGSTGKRGRRPVTLSQGKFVVSKLGATSFDWRDPYYLAVATSWPVFTCLALAVMVFAITAFAMLLKLDPHSLRGPEPLRLGQVFYFSLQNVSTAGFGAATPYSTYGYFVAGIERIVGVALLPVTTGIIFVRFSRAKAGIVFADKVVVTTRDGAPQLRIRLANGRSGMLTGATAKASVLLREEDASGEIWRRYHDLQLVRNTLPLFPLTWTIMHKIDDSSPLAGLDACSLERAWAQIVVSVQARDAHLGHEIEDVGVYQPGDVLYGMHYCAVIEHDELGATVADIRRLSLVEPDPATV
jgi:inward rectifier potassium channel